MYKYFSAICRQKCNLHFQPFIETDKKANIWPEKTKVLMTLLTRTLQSYRAELDIMWKRKRNGLFNNPQDRTKIYRSCDDLNYFTHFLFHQYLTCKVPKTGCNVDRAFKATERNKDFLGRNTWKLSVSASFLKLICYCCAFVMSASVSRFEGEVAWFAFVAQGK